MKKEENNLNINKIFDKIVNFAKACIIIYICILLVLISVKAFYKTGYFPSTFDNAIEKTDYKYDNILENLAYIILILSIIFGLNKLLLNIKLKYVIPIVFAIIFVGFVWFVLTLASVPIADQGQIMILAEAIRDDAILHRVISGTYLEMFPYQFGFGFYASIVLKLFANVKVEGYMILQILNCIYSIICMVLMYLIGNRLLKGEAQKRIMFILITLFSFYFLFFNTHVYGNLPGLMFALLAVLCTIRFIQDEKIYNIIIAGISIFAAIYLKTNYQIFLIAIIGILSMHFMNKISIKTFISIILIAVIYFTCNFVGTKILENTIGRVTPAGVPMITYIYMGWAPSNTLSSGWYTGDVINIYVDSDFDHILTAEKTKGLFAKRIKHFHNDVKEFVRYAWDKFDSTWLNPTFQTIWVATPGLARMSDDYDKVLEKNPWIKDLVNYDSKAFHIEERLFDAFQVIVFGFSVLGVIRLRKENESLLPAVIFIGGLVFHFLLWETKAIYVIGYYFLLLPYAAEGITISLKKIEELFLNLKKEK